MVHSEDLYNQWTESEIDDIERELALQHMMEEEAGWDEYVKDQLPFTIVFMPSNEEPF